MNIKATFLLLLLIIPFKILGQPSVDDIKLCLERVELNKQFTLVVISHEKCGYCSIALKELVGHSDHPKVDIVVLDYSDQDNLRGSHDKYHSLYTFIDNQSCGLKAKPKIFPQLFLFNDENKVIWQKNGWRDKNLKIINKKIERYQG